MAIKDIHKCMSTLERAPEDWGLDLPNNEAPRISDFPEHKFFQPLQVGSFYR
jgi:hypothetical protein